MPNLEIKLLELLLTTREFTENGRYYIVDPLFKDGNKYMITINDVTKEVEDEKFDESIGN